MNKIKSIFIAGLMAMISNAALANTIVINFTGTVQNFDDTYGMLGGSLSVGETVTGALSFVTGQVDTDPLAQMATYNYSSGEMRTQINTSIGVFDTGSDGYGSMDVTNDHPQHGDYIGIYNYTNSGAQADNRYLNSINWWMQNYYAPFDAIDSDAEPTNIVPNDWDTIYLNVSGNRDIYYPDYNYSEFQNYNFRVNITSATVSTVPLPAAVWLFGAGILGLFGFAYRKNT